jgi:argininosuccinate lyase
MWGGRFAAPPSALLRALNDSFAFDRELFAEDVEGSAAWAAALHEAGVLTESEAKTLTAALGKIPPPEGSVPWGDRRPRLSEGSTGEGARSPTEAASLDHEDVHSYVEAKLYELAGPLAGKLHTGRSRNDQVATDLKLWMRNACDDALAHATALARALALRAREEAATPMPGYTHSKQAEPVTFGHWCLAYAEMLARDLGRLHDARERGNECPLGSGALAGTPLPIDREMLAASLGFDRATRNSLDGVSDRDFAAEYLFTCTLMLTHLSRLAEDLIFFTSDECAYAELPDALATGSSRMPQKKNPDVLELARGYAARLLGELTGFLALLKGLPLAYDKDLQLDKEPLFRTRTVVGTLLPALTALVSTLILDRDRMRAAAGGEALLATAVADAIAAGGTPFREAHEEVSRNLANLPALAAQHGVTLESILARKSALGGTSPERVAEAAAAMLEVLQ